MNLAALRIAHDIAGFILRGPLPICACNLLPGNQHCHLDANAFVIKIDPNASGPSSVVYFSYLGGIGEDPLDSANRTTTTAYSIAVDPNCTTDCNAYMAGYTNDPTFPTTPSNQVGANIVQASPFQPAQACGTTTGGNFPCTEGFVAKVSGDGKSLLYSSYLGGNGSDTAYGITADSAGNAYVTGTTCSATFPTTAGAYQSSYAGTCGSGGTAFSGAIPYKAFSEVGVPFFTEVGPDGSMLVYSTFFGSSPCCAGTAIALDSFGDVFIAGVSSDPDSVPAVNPLPAQTCPFGGCDFGFIAAFDPSGTPRFSTRLLWTLLGEAVDTSGNLYVGGGVFGGDYTLTTSSLSVPGQSSPVALTTGLVAEIAMNRNQPTITWANPPAITYGTALSSTQLNATVAYNGTPVTGTFTYVPPSGTVLGVGSNQAISMQFTPTDTIDYGIVTDTVQITVQPAGPTIIPSSEISTTGSGLLYSRVSKTYSGTVTITNIGATTINGPLEASFTSLPADVTLTNATGTYNGAPFRFIARDRRGRRSAIRGLVAFARGEARCRLCQKHFHARIDRCD